MIWQVDIYLAARNGRIQAGHVLFHSYAERSDVLSQLLLTHAGTAGASTSRAARSAEEVARGDVPFVAASSMPKSYGNLHPTIVLDNLVPFGHGCIAVPLSIPLTVTGAFLNRGASCAPGTVRADLLGGPTGTAGQGHLASSPVPGGTTDVGRHGILQRNMLEGARTRRTALAVQVVRRKSELMSMGTLHPHRPKVTVVRADSAVPELAKALVYFRFTFAKHVIRTLPLGALWAATGAVLPHDVIERSLPCMTALLAVATGFHHLEPLRRDERLHGRVRHADPLGAEGGKYALDGRHGVLS